MTLIGHIKEIWRYPVKSMRGERLESCAIGDKGLSGDRGWAVRDEMAGEIRGGRQIPRLLHCRARYQREPEAEPYPAALIELPDGRELASDDPAAATALSEWLERPVTVWPLRAPADAEHYRRLPGTIDDLREQFGRVAGEPLPDMAIFPPILMQYVAIPGTYFDVLPLHLLTTASLAYLAARNPAADWKVQRFRPNVVVDSGALSGLIEAHWAGRTIRLGDVELDCYSPAPRCAITAHAQGQAVEKDPSILRTIVREANQNLGVYCSVKTAGRIQIGDTVEVSGNPPRETMGAVT